MIGYTRWIYNECFYLFLEQLVQNKSYKSIKGEEGSQ